MSKLKEHERRGSIVADKTKSMEVHPMKGRSRGEWYCSWDDIAPSEEEAEYWAVFGTTHRGITHCLGEFPTKSAAEAVAYGFKPLRDRVASPPSHDGRKVIQIEVVADQNEPAMVDIFALCDDGSIWRRGIGTGRHTGLIDEQWERIPLDGLEDVAPENAFRVVIAASH